MSIVYLKVYVVSMEAPHQVVVAYFVRASHAPIFTVQVVRNMRSIWRPMLTLIPEKSDLERNENVMEHKAPEEGLHTHCSFFIIVIKFLICSYNHIVLSFSIAVAYYQ